KAVLVDIFSSTGQKLFSESLDFQSGAALKHYSCRDWPSGMYWVRVSDVKGGVLRKIVIE
ncbi:MAG TPA: T9SS type A sorting domain-containing protein, partial [Saprospiraceae bacterium]|nr:T9SS type A sorting domain-containing protein [Saprospiraceae bacterium]